ncbi:carbohydrate binding domain-containing protein [Halanaerobacter jeridensis]|uniref:Beta-glucanase (GH16 family) n=1 Tax=Halanaerobacter jeridensis TaxID=706427 RepID=A0A938XQV9_9FIRM|nr:family 16 glycosylhydrolase [Halanaerobacter jeridensis]MBM7555693.1 beta-glucanase (GH16 family) [Halanaerobacter jeridensis]
MNSKHKISFVLILGLILLTVLSGCKGGEAGSGTSQLIVNVTNQEVTNPEVSVLYKDKEVAKKEGAQVQFELKNVLYQVQVQSEEYGSKTYDVYVYDDNTLDINLKGSNNLLGNGTFTSGLSTNEPDKNGRVDTEDNWILYTNSGGAAQAFIKDEQAKVRVSSAGNNPHSVQFIQAPVTLERGAKYKVTFDAKTAIGTKKMHLKVGADGNRGWSGYIEEQKELNNQWSHYQAEFSMAQETDEYARFELWFLNKGTYFLDNVKMVKVGQEELAEEGTKTEADENKVENWELVWKDEFNGEEVNEEKWTFEVGNGHKQGIPGWGNAELQYYTDGENAKIEDGKLVITAREEQVSDSYGSYDYTSTRMITQNKFSKAYGKFEIRAKMPEGQGIWPAIWMLGSDIGEVGWPKCGEIDIMEYIGDSPSKVHGTVHGPVSGGAGIGSTYKLPDGEKFSEEFHTFMMEWDEDEVEFYVDDTLFHVVNKDEVGDKEWVYDHPHFLILNLAVGGHWPGNPDETTEFPQTMEVDYIRVYEDTNSEDITGEEKWDSEYEEEWKEAKKQKENNLSINEVVNGDFANDIANDPSNKRDNWYVWAGEGGKISSHSVENGEAKINVADIGNKSWNAQFNQWLKLEPGTTYEVSFEARAEKARDINVKLLHPKDYTVYGDGVKELSSGMESYSMQVTIPEDSDDIVNLSFELGAVSGQSKATAVYFDNVSIEKID